MGSEKNNHVLEGKYVIFRYGEQDTIDEAWALALYHLEGGELKEIYHPGDYVLEPCDMGDEQINDARLQVPHPGIQQRAFVLYPLNEILPDCEIPGLGRLSRLISHCPADGIDRLEAGS